MFRGQKGLVAGNRARSSHVRRNGHKHLADLRDHLSAGARPLRAITGYDATAFELDDLAANAEAQFRDLDALERCLGGSLERS